MTGRTSRVITVPTDGLTRVLSRPPLGEYLRRLWERRFFIAADAKARVEAGTRSNLLGKVWLVLNPILDATVYFMIFGMLLNSSKGIPNFIGYLVIGVFLFSFTTRCLTGGARSIASGRPLIRAFSFPRASIPVATVTRETLQFIPVLATMLALVLVMPWLMPLLNPEADPIEPHVTWRWLLLPVVLILQLAMNLGLAFLAARLCSRIPDFVQLIGIFCRFWLYASAVFFSEARFASIPWMESVMHLNPMFQVLDITRDALLYGVTPEASSWVVLSAWAVGLLVVGSVVFWRGEESYGSD